MQHTTTTTTKTFDGTAGIRGAYSCERACVCARALLYESVSIQEWIKKFNLIRIHGWIWSAAIVEARERRVAAYEYTFTYEIWLSCLAIAWSYVRLPFPIFMFSLWLLSRFVCLFVCEGGGGCKPELTKYTCTNVDGSYKYARKPLPIINIYTCRIFVEVMVV